jgi:hypothetical protein
MQLQYTTSVKLTLTVALTLLLFGLLSWVIIASQTTQLASTRIKDKSVTTLNQLEEIIRPHLINNDTVGVQFALRDATQDPTITGASLFDVANNLIAQSKQDVEISEQTEIFHRQLMVDDAQAGLLKIEINSQSILTKYSYLPLSWALLWIFFSAATIYTTYRYSQQHYRRLRILTNRLPGANDPMADEMLALETRIQPLLSNSRESDALVLGGFYCSMITAYISNRADLNKQLNHENLDLLIENIDLCIDRTIELYGGHRVEGRDDSIGFYIRSTECSKQHTLVCMMAVFSLQQLLKQLSMKLGIDLAIKWAICSDNIPALPTFLHHENLFLLKQSCQAIAPNIERDKIVLRSFEYTGDELSSIAIFKKFDDYHYLLEGFSEQRQLLLEKQIAYLVSICL